MNDEGVSGSHAVGIEGGLAALEDQLDFPSFLMDRCGFIKGKLHVAGNEKQFSTTSVFVCKDLLNQAHRKIQPPEINVACGACFQSERLDADEGAFMLVFLAQGQSPVGFDGQHKILLTLELDVDHVVLG